MRKFPMLVLGALAVLSLAQPALAREGGHRNRPHSSPAKAHARHASAAPSSWQGDIHRFHDRDLPRWRSGRWSHGVHEGRSGWWWVVGSTWYFYLNPVYPYPDPYTPSGYAVVTETPVYYYCPNPSGYYPYVSYCHGGWQKLVTQAATPVVVASPASTTTVVVSPPAPPQGTRDADYRKLNAFADEFYHINYRKPTASAKLKDLGKRVEDFRHVLYERDYNAMEVLRDAEDLKERIAHQRRSLALGDTTAPSLPAGTKVAFPME